jgi:hypothetical protein
MKNIKVCIVLCLFLNVLQLMAQDSIKVAPPLDKTTIGIGMGLDYGGVGVNFLTYPGKRLGLFMGGGYAIAAFGINAGIKYRFIANKPTSKMNPYILAIYGYNAAIAVLKATQYNKLFYGPSIGFGLDFRPNYQKRGYWTLAILVPFRGSEVDTYMDDLKTQHGVEFKNSLTPIMMSFGYRLIVGK